MGTGLHQFGLGQNTSAARRLLKARSGQQKFIAGGGSAPSLTDVIMLTSPDGVSFQTTMAIARGFHVQLRVVLVNLLVQYRPTALSMRDINTEIL